MIKIYHGGLSEVMNPEIRKPNRSLDYGSGFYTTTSFEQARRLVERRMKDNNVSTGYVSAYGLDEEAISHQYANPHHGIENI